MNIKQFLDYNTNCPICNNELILCMQWSNVGFERDRLFLSYYQDRMFHFTEHPKNIKPISMQKNKKEVNIEMFLDCDARISFNSLDAEKCSQEQDDIYFFYICNPDGITFEGSEYNINLYHSCYYRSTPFTNFNKKEITFKQPLTNRDENFSLKKKGKAYLVSSNYEDKKTTLWYYTFTEEEEKNEHFEPRIFEQDLPLLPNGFDFSLENRDHLLDKLYSFIILS